MQDPNTIDPVTMSSLDLRKSEDYWLLWGSAVCHDRNKKTLSISTRSLKKGNSIGCCITTGGDLEIYINKKKRAIGWHNVPVDKPLWGVVEMYGEAVTIQSEFYCGELSLYNVCSVSHSYMYMYIYVLYISS